MQFENGATRSSWMATAEEPPSGRIDQDVRADVCIIGAGIAGVTTAWMLAQEGRRVVLLDDGPVGGGETGRTTAHLSNAIDDRYTELERIHGVEGARIAAESHGAAIDRIGQIASELGIDCAYERLDGYLFAPPGESPWILDEERDAARRAGLADVELVERAPIEAFHTGPALRFPRQAQFHPLRYLAALTREIQKAGGRVFTHTRARRVEGGPDARVETEPGPVVRAEAVVVATNTPMNDQFIIHSKQAPYRTFAIAARVPRGSATRALYWDTPDPYHYVRLQVATGNEPDDLLIVGGEDHKTGHADDADERFRRLESWARERWPVMRDVAYRWSGQVMETMDGLAYIGHNPNDKPNVYIATGDSGHGMTHGTIAGILLTDLIMGRENPWAAVYDPARKRLRAAGDYLRENLDVAARYMDYARPAEVNSTDEILPGGGAIMRRGLKLVAVSRDAAGQLHERSAVCPHMGCIVRWNSLEKSWDCPCHGSRFDPCGELLNAPAVDGLPATTEVLQEPTQS